MSTVKCATCGYTEDSSESMCSRCGTPYPVTLSSGQDTTIRKGQVIANRYVVLDMIGRGGMGCIYKVKDNTLGEIVALKTLLPEYVQEKIVVERFFNEARIARGLSHPHIVRVHDIGTADSIVYISMELLEGRTLRSMMDKVRPGNRIPLNAILRMFDALCSALEYAHEFTVHRDIKPENVMVLPDGTIKLMDFGISKLMSNPNLTSASMVMGTPHYMSPEQMKNSANVDGRADIYSVGIMLYEILTGDVPTAVTPSDTLQEVPRALDPIIAKCCSRDPAKRYQTVGELRSALRTIREQIETQSKPNSEADPAQDSSARRTRNLFRAAAMLVVLIGIGTASYTAFKVAQEKQRDVVYNATQSTDATEAPPPTTESGQSAPQSSISIEDLVSRARTQSQDALQSMQNEPHYALATQLFKQADAQWEIVRANNSTAQYLPVLQKYLAVLNWPSGMTFVPANDTLVRVNGLEKSYPGPPFFIDIHAVETIAFENFCSKFKWRVPTKMSRNIRAATHVTYYDAQAYLAKNSASKILPTPIQWKMAANLTKPHASQHEDEDETAFVSPMKWTQYEWARSTAAGDTPEELFGTMMPVIMWENVVLGSVTVRTTQMPYEGANAGVGFRGVIELPHTLNEARTWLN